MMTLSLKILFTVSLTSLFFIGCDNSNSSGSKNKDTLTVMTYNIHHSSPPTGADTIIDVEGIAKAINHVQPDLVALQEIDVHTGRSGKDLDQAKKLAQLTGMHSYFTKTLDFDGGQYGIAVLTRLPIEDSIGYLLPIAPGAKEETRAVCMIKVNLSGNRNLYFASTHLGLSKATRLLQADSLSKIANSIKGPFIIGGDFNSTPGSETIDKISSFLKRSCTSDCASTFPYDQPREKIDFIFYNPEDVLEPLDQEALNDFKGSDHLPVVVHFRLK